MSLILTPVGYQVESWAALIVSPVSVLIAGMSYMMDAAISPGRVQRARRQMSSTASPGKDGRLGRRCAKVHFRRTRGWCQSRTVPGGTGNERHPTRVKPGQQRDQRPVGPGKPWALNLPAKDGQLIAEDKDFGVLGDGAHPVHADEFQGPASESVEERQSHGKQPRRARLCRSRGVGK